MGYLKKIDESKQKIYNHSIASRILNLVGDLTLNSNEYAQRRWVWELLQNAKDTAYPNRPVKIKIDYDRENNSLEFCHNGMPFSIDNVTFLIEQVSTKDRDPDKRTKNKTSGKFGTGFLTTHLLSKIVDVESVVKEPELPYKRFKLTLDRSGTEIDTVIESVSNSISILGELDEVEEYKGFNEADFNTKFTYFLQTDGIDTAAKGLADLELSIMYVLIFVENIQSVELDNQISYEVQRQTIVLDDNIEIYTVQKQNGELYEEVFFAIVKEGIVSVAIEVKYENNRYRFVNPDSQLPRFYCDFPLIGTEKFNFPLVINSSFFNPTEPRNGVYLTDKHDGKITENKELLKKAGELYIKLLKYSAEHEWFDLWVLAQLFESSNYDWLSKTWYNNEILNPLRAQILKIPIVDTPRFGRIPIECGGFGEIPEGATLDFPKDRNQESTEIIWALSQNSYFITPDESEYKKWSKIIWDTKYHLNTNTLIGLVENKKELVNLSKSLNLSEIETIHWLNKLYELIVANSLEKDVYQKDIIPNQKGVFRRKDDLMIEKGDIPEILKDIIYDLGTDFRTKLIVKGINELNMAHCSDEMIATEISREVKKRLSEINRSDETKQIFKKLYLWFGQNSLQAKTLFDNLYENKHKLLDDDEIVNSIEKAERYNELLALDGQISVERIMQLLELEELSKGFNVDKNYQPDEIQKLKNFENGWKGEAFVYKKLKESGFNVIWENKSASPTNIVITDFEGETHYIDDQMNKYDLLIQVDENKITFIQAKTTTTDISRADEIAMPISVREWKFVNEITDNNSYYITRVFNINHNPEAYFMKVENIESIN